MVANSIFLFLLAVGALNVALSVTYTCDPFYNLLQERQQTCPSAIIGHNATAEHLTVYSSFLGCDNTQNQSISTFFSSNISPYTVQIDPGYEFYFQYTIIWTSTESNCVVDLTPDGAGTNSSNPAVSWSFVDQNGIPNHPLENLTDFALNTPYTRRFIINPGSPTSYRFGFTCAQRNGENSTNAEQTALITSITYGMTAEWANWNRAVFQPGWMEFGCTTNGSCPDPAPHDDAVCAKVQPWGSAMWFYKGSYYAHELSSTPVFSEDLYVDEIAWGDSGIGGCIYPWHQDRVTIVLQPNWLMRLRFGEHCTFFPYTIVGRLNINTPLAHMPEHRNCTFTLHENQVQMTFASPTHVDIYAPLSAWSIVCPSKPIVEQGTPFQGPYSGNRMVWIIVGSVVGAVLIAVIIGTIFGVRKCKKLRQLKKDEKDEKGDQAPVAQQSERR